MRAQTTAPVRRLLDALSGTGPRVVDPVRARGRNERVTDSWEYVMPWQVRSEQHRRPVAGADRARGVLRPGAGSPA